MRELVEAITDSDILKVALLLKNEDIRAQIDERRINSWYPLQHAASTGDVVVMEMLLRAGADPNIRCDTDVFSIVCEHKSIELLRLVLDYGIDPNRYVGYTTAFASACRGISAEMLELLLSRGADLTKFENEEDSAFFLACTAPTASLEVAEYMLKHHKQDVFSLMPDVLYETCEHDGDLDLVKLLVKYGVDVNVFKENYMGIRMTPLMALLEASHDDILPIASVLLKNGADVHLSDNKQRTAWVRAKYHADPEIRDLFEQHVQLKGVGSH